MEVAWQAEEREREEEDRGPPPGCSSRTRTRRPDRAPREPRQSAPPSRIPEGNAAAAAGAEAEPSSTAATDGQQWQPQLPLEWQRLPPGQWRTKGKKY